MNGDSVVATDNLLHTYVRSPVSKHHGSRTPMRMNGTESPHSIRPRPPSYSMPQQSAAGPQGSIHDSTANGAPPSLPHLGRSPAYSVDDVDVHATARRQRIVRRTVSVSGQNSPTFQRRKSILKMPTHDSEEPQKLKRRVSFADTHDLELTEVKVIQNSHYSPVADHSEQNNQPPDKKKNRKKKRRFFCTIQ